MCLAIWLLDTAKKALLMLIDTKLREISQVLWHNEGCKNKMYI